MSKQGYMMRYMCSSSICERRLKSLAAVTPLQSTASAADPTVKAPLLIPASFKTSRKYTQECMKSTRSRASCQPTLGKCSAAQSLEASVSTMTWNHPAMLNITLDNSASCIPTVTIPACSAG